MTDASQRFEQAVTASRDLPERPDDDTLLQLYALYKQATDGDVHGERPGFLDFVGGAKYDAWSQLAGMSGEEAKRQYVELVTALGGDTG